LSPKEVYQFRGLGASPGKIIGKAKLVFELKDLERVERGDIIVAPMTNPDMTVALGKASAVITDAGGLSSHAAIIARELKIPAVVGTEIATKILQDGMIVEVDGIKGEVKILSKEDVEIPTYLEKTKDTYTIFGNRCPITTIKTPRKEPFFKRVSDITWENPPNKINVIAPRPEIRNTPFTGSLIIPAIERLPFALGFDDVGPMYAYVMNHLLYISYEKISEVMERSKSMLLNERRWKSYLKNLYEKYDLFTKVTREINEVEEVKDFEHLLEGAFIEWWKAHNSFFSQTFLIQAWGDEIIWPLIKQILEKYYTREQALELLSKLSKLPEPIPSVEFYSDFQKLVSMIPVKVLEKLIHGKGEEKKKVFEDLKKNVLFTEFMKKWYWVRDRDFYYGDIRDVDIFSHFVKLLGESKRIENEPPEPLGKIAEKIGKEDKERLEYLIEVGRILKKERDYHHFLWLKNTSVIRDLFLNYGSTLKEKGISEEPRDIFFLWIPEIYDLLEGKLRQEEIRELVKIRKKNFMRQVQWKSK